MMYNFKRAIHYEISPSKLQIKIFELILFEIQLSPLNQILTNKILLNDHSYLFHMHRNKVLYVKLLLSYYLLLNMMEFGIQLKLNQELC